MALGQLGAEHEAQRALWLGELRAAECERQHADAVHAASRAAHEALHAEHVVLRAEHQQLQARAACMHGDVEELEERRDGFEKYTALAASECGLLLPEDGLEPQTGASPSAVQSLKNDWHMRRDFEWCVPVADLHDYGGKIQIERRQMRIGGMGCYNLLGGRACDFATWSAIAPSLAARLSQVPADAHRSRALGEIGPCAQRGHIDPATK